MLAFATRHCGTDVDLQRAAGVLDDLKATGRRTDEQRFAERALAVLLTHQGRSPGSAGEAAEV